MHKVKLICRNPSPVCITQSKLNIARRTNPGNVQKPGIHIQTYYPAIHPNQLTQEPGNPARPTTNIKARPTLPHSNQTEHSQRLRSHRLALNPQPRNLPCTTLNRVTATVKIQTRSHQTILAKPELPGKWEILDLMSKKQIEMGPLLAVSLERQHDMPTLVMTRDFSQSPALVWAALTRKDQLPEWSPLLASENLDRCGQVEIFKNGEQGGETTEEQVLVADPPQALAYTWGGDLLHWQLEAIGDGTRLTLRHSVNGDWLIKVAAGWHICLAVMERWLEGQPVGAIVGEEARQYGWQQLHDRYAQRLQAMKGALA